MIRMGLRENKMKLLRLFVAIAIVLPYVKANESGMCKQLLISIYLFHIESSQ